MHGPAAPDEGLALQSKDDVVVAHPGSRVPALQLGALALAAGERVALIGASGAGKSTLLATVAGELVPQRGELRAQASCLLTQRTELFHDSLRDNLRLADPAADDARLWAVLHAAGLADEVRAMARGLDTVLGEGGLGLSGGQSRRLALARLLLRNGRLLAAGRTHRSAGHCDRTRCAAASARPGRRTHPVDRHPSAARGCAGRPPAVHAGRPHHRRPAPRHGRLRRQRSARCGPTEIARRPQEHERNPMDLDIVALSRLQFALTALYHFLFVPLTLGLSVHAGDHGERLRDDRPRHLARHDEVLGHAVRHQLRDGRGHRHRHGIPVRHELGLLQPLRRRHLRRAAGHRRADGLLPRSDLRRPVLLRLGQAVARSATWSSPGWWRSAPTSRRCGS